MAAVRYESNRLTIHLRFPGLMNVSDICNFTANVIYGLLRNLVPPWFCGSDLFSLEFKICGLYFIHNNLFIGVTTTKFDNTGKNN